MINKTKRQKNKDLLEYSNSNKNDIRHYDITLFINRNRIHLEFYFQKRHTHKFRIEQMKSQKSQDSPY